MNPKTTIQAEARNHSSQFIGKCETPVKVPTANRFGFAKRGGWNRFAFINIFIPGGKYVFTSKAGVHPRSHPGEVKVWFISHRDTEAGKRAYLNNLAYSRQLMERGEQQISREEKLMFLSEESRESGSSFFIESSFSKDFQNSEIPCKINYFSGFWDFQVSKFTKQKL